MALKVLYHIGDEISASTKMKKGMLQTESSPYVIVSDNGNIVLDHILLTEATAVPGGGTIIKVKTDALVIFLLVPRVYIDKGSGFVIVNRHKTMELLRLFNQR